MGKLIFTFASLAYTVDADWGRGVPRKGMERLAGIAHAHGIPVTWLVDTGSAGAMQAQINQWHEQYGDDVAINWESSFAVPTAQQDAPAALSALREMFPWSGVTLAASGQRTDQVLAQVKKAGLTGLWGSCWEQIEIDRITDRGEPWGFFYCADDCFKIPARTPGGVISVEWTARDLCKSIHSNAPTVYSTDPDDVGRTGLCTGDDIEYWKGLFDNYLRNTAHNEFVFFSQHQESHEMEYGEVCRSYTPAEIDRSAQMLDKFFRYGRSHGDAVQFCTIPQALEIYRQHNPSTAPSIMLFDDVPCRKPPFWYAKGWPTGPWPRTLLYYDADCQMAFIEDGFHPFLLRDYIHHRDASDPGYFREPNPPRVFCDTPWEVKEFTEIPFRIPCDRELSFGVALWYDFTRFRVEHVEGAQAIGPIEDQVLLLRLNLESGENRVFVKLTER